MDVRHYGSNNLMTSSTSAEVMEVEVDISTPASTLASYTTTSATSASCMSVSEPVSSTSVSSTPVSSTPAKQVPTDGDKDIDEAKITD